MSGDGFGKLFCPQIHQGERPKEEEGKKKKRGGQGGKINSRYSVKSSDKRHGEHLTSIQGTGNPLQVFIAN